MPQKKRVIMEVGSLLKPIFKYVTEMNIQANPVDVYGTRISRHLYKQTLFLDHRIHQPNLKCNYTESLKCRSSVLHLKFINGWERRFFLRYADMDAINTQIEMYNHFIEGTRALQGHDDEPEDEIATL